MDTAPQLVYARLDKHLLEEIPKMFTSASAMLCELFQNCYRGGATLVRVTYDDSASAPTLEFRDNGPGLEQPDVLFSAGESGWGAEVKEPAGLGLFSVLAFAGMVVYESRLADGRAWRVTASPGILMGSPATVEVLESNEERGFRVRLHLKPDVDITKSLVHKARALYPYTVTWEDGDGTCTLEPYREWQPATISTTPAGTLDWAAAKYHGANFEWECQVKRSENLRRALQAAAEKHPYPALARVIVQGSLLWHIDPGPDVQLHLPDRTEIVDNRALHRAARQIVDAVVAEVIEQARAITQVWPDKINRYEVPKAKVSLPAWIHDLEMRRALLPILGWKRVCFEDPHHLSVYDNDGIVVEADDTEYFERSAKPVPSAALNLTLNLMGTSTCLDPAAKSPKVSIAGLQFDPEASSRVALARRIEVDGQSLPWLLASDEAFDLPGLTHVSCPFIFAGTARKCVLFLNNHPEAWVVQNAIALWEYSYGDDAYEWVDGDDELNHQRLCEMLTLEVTNAYQPSLGKKRAQYYKVEQAANAALSTTLALISLARDMAATRHPSVTTQQRSVEMMNRQLRGIQAKLQAVQRQLAQDVGIAPTQQEAKLSKASKKKAMRS